MTELRYGDRPSTEATIEIQAPPERVWELVSDIDLPGRFSTEFAGATWLDGATGPAMGARFRGRNSHPAIGDWETTSTVVRCETAREFSWAVGDPDDATATWLFTLQPTTTGTILTQRMEIGPGRSYLSQAIEGRPDREDRIIRRRLEEHRANMEATLRGVKALAEAA